MYQKRIVTSYQQYCNDVDLHVAFVHPISLRIEGIFIEGIYGGPLDTTSKATLDTPAANIQRHISVFPGKTNLVERTCLIESGEGRSWGLKLTKRGFIEATYTAVFMIRVSFLDSQAHTSIGIRSVDLFNK